MQHARLTMTITVGLLSVLGVAATINFLINGGANEGFAEYPTTTHLHVIPGLIYMALAPFQFITSIRRNNPGFHRWSGRVLVTISLISGAAAFFIALVFPYSGLPEQIVVGGFAAFFLFAIAKGFQTARGRDFSQHREWMMRAFAIGLSIVTMRLIFVPMLIAFGPPTRSDAEFFSILSFTLAFLLHTAVAEWWIRYTRPTPMRSAQAAVSPTT